MDYKAALQVINDLTKFGINLGLERITALLKLFGDPQELLPVIHVGGTNGKGSVSAILSSVLKEAGYKVGTYTSPHLVSYTERIMVNGVSISESDFAGLVEEIIPAFKQVQSITGEYPTEFEVLTAMSFIYFFQQKVDIVILEVGMGGDIDSTNIVRQPLVSVITNVSIDHTEYLGMTVKEIATKKSGIIKPHCPLVTASDDEVVLGVLRSKAQSETAPFYEVTREVFWEFKEETERGQVFNAKTVFTDYGELFLPLYGEHQLVNCATALRVVALLNGKGWNIKAEQIKRGVAEVKWPGRLEILRKEPLVIIDGAHNLAGIEVLSRWLQKKKSCAGRVILIAGMLADKDKARAAAVIEPFVDKVFVTRPLSPRAGTWQELAQCFHKKFGDIRVIEPLSEALEEVFCEAGPSDMIVITGSLYLVGEARRLLTKG